MFKLSAILKFYLLRFFDNLVNFLIYYNLNEQS